MSKLYNILIDVKYALFICQVY